MISTGTHPIDRNAILIYPNPVEDFLYLESDVLMKNGAVQIYDINGKQVASHAISRDKRIQKIPTAYLSSGRYVI